MTQLIRANEWVQYADDNWWNPAAILPVVEIHLHVREIIKVMEDAHTAGNRDRVWGDIQRVKNRAISMSNFDAGVALNKCAQIALDLGYIAESGELFYEARGNIGLGHQHRFAVVSWMLGCVFWLQPGSRQNKAISLWQQAIDLFTRLAQDSTTNIPRMQWYKEQIDIMTRSLQYAIEENELPDKRDILGLSPAAFPSTGSTSTPGATPAPSSGTTGSNSTPPPMEPIENFMELFVVYEEIPAGLPGAVAYQPTPRYPAGYKDLSASDYIEVTRVRIGEKEYHVRTLDVSSRRVNLIDPHHHYVLKVRGNSMNQAGIVDGDFVVLRSQVTARNGDIVAAEILGVDVSRATLKRYTARDKTITLQAESSE
ncbi:MAG: S24 family peptidase, partial [Anaerolineales bacterium]